MHAGVVLFESRNNVFSYNALTGLKLSRRGDTVTPQDLRLGTFGVEKSPRLIGAARPRNGLSGEVDDLSHRAATAPSSSSSCPRTVRS